MVVYILAFVLSIAIAHSTKYVVDERKKKILFIISSIPFIIVSAIRYEVGTDYMVRYFPDYIKIANGETIENLEPLFYLLIKICTFITSQPYILFVITSIIIYLLIFKSFEEESKNWILSITIFFVACFFFQSMNLVRQYIAMALIMYAHKYLFDKTNKKYLWYLFVLTATLVHSISLVYLILIFLKKKKINVIWVILIAILTVLLGNAIVKYGYDFFRSINISNIQKYATYFRRTGDFSWSLFLTESILYAFLYYFNKRDESDEKKNLYTNLQGLAVIFIVLSSRIELFSRLSELLTMFQMISIPYFFSQKDNFNITIKGKEFNVRKVCLIAIITLYTVRLIFAVLFNGAYEVLPYRTVFEIL